MSINEIKSLAERRPFRPFTIRFENGDVLNIIASTELLFPQNKRNTVLVFEFGGRMWIFDVEAVTALQQ